MWIDITITKSTAIHQFVLHYTAVVEVPRIKITLLQHEYSKHNIDDNLQPNYIEIHK